MRTRDYPLFVFGTALPPTLCGSLTSSCWHFWRSRKLAGVNSLRSDYPLIFMPIRAVLLGPCGWLSSGVRSASTVTSLARGARASRWVMFHSPRRLDSHGWNSFFAHRCCPACACFHVRENHECSQFPVIALPLAGTAEPCFLLLLGDNTPEALIGRSLLLVYAIATDTELLKCERNVRSPPGRAPPSRTPKSLQKIKPGARNGKGHC
jgi:hypothetical protein